MDPKAIASKLHENEGKILIALRDLKKATTEELSSSTGLNKDAVERACAWAKTKGAVSFEEEVSNIYHLSEEGETYAEEGLPEKQLLELIINGEKEIEKLKETFPTLNIALVWAKKNNWVNIKKGVLELTDQGKKAEKEETPDEKIIRRLTESPLEDLETGEVMKERVSQLLSRGLIRKVKKVDRRVELTDFGIDVIPHVELALEKKVITQITPELLQSKGWRGAGFQKYDVTLPVPSIKVGKRHYISQMIDYIRRFWVELGFKEMKGEYLELSFWNFDALFQPQDHPARDLADTFYMNTPYSGGLPESGMVKRVKETHENGWTTGSTGWQYDWDPELARRNCLRTHTTSLSVNTIARLTEEDLPAKFFSVGRVFRNETIDWNHLAEFYQTDGIVVGDGVTFRDLQGYLKAFLEGMGMEKFRFRPGFFPYTEPSMEAEVWIEERQEWMELFGSGMFRPEVVKPLFGRDVPVLAWGPGFDRLLMRSYRINSIRDLYGNDIGYLRKARLWI